MEEHWEPKRNDKFHKALREQIKDNVKFKILENAKFNNLADIEDYAME